VTDQDDFFTAIFKDATGFLEMRSIKKARVNAVFYPLPPTNIPEFSEDRDHYFGVAPRIRESGKEKDVERIHCLWLDVDAKVFEGSKEFALNRINGWWQTPRFTEIAPLDPSIIIDSGHGYHTYWLLSEPIEPGEARVLMDILRQTVNDALDKVSDPSRILRVPYTWNHKDEPALWIQPVTFEPERRFAPLVFRRLKGIWSEYLGTEKSPIAAPLGETDWGELLQGTSEGKRHEAALKLVGHWLGLGMIINEVRVHAISWNDRNQPPLPKAELERIVKDIALKELAKCEEILHVDPTPENKAALLQGASADIGFNILKVRRIEGDEASIELILKNGKVFIPLKTLDSPAGFRQAIMQAVNIRPRVQIKKFNSLVNRLLNAAERVEASETTLAEQLKDWLSAWPALIPPMLQENGEVEAGSWPPKAIRHENQLWISTPHFWRHLKILYDYRDGQRALASQLTRLEFESRTIRIRLQDGTSRNAKMRLVPAVFEEER